MRALFLPVGALVLGVAVVVVGGRMVDRRWDVDPADVADIALDQPDPEDRAAMDDGVAAGLLETSQPVAPPADEPGQIAAASPPPATSATQPPAAAGPAAPVDPQSSGASRMVAPAVVASPELSVLQREAPRQPLSRLSLALPPQPEIRNEWAGTPFFRPLAVESAVFQSMGRTIAISGVKSVPADESCIYEGAEWPCGMRARTAFRLWLRGRALVCQLPDEQHEVTRARCRLAKQDAGSWLVSHGWALAAPDGPYVQAEEKARAAKIGMFGAPPDASSIADVPDAPVPSGASLEPVMTEQGVDPDPPVYPRMAFPPAPAP